MKSANFFRWLLFSGFASLISCLAPHPVHAQTHELGFTLGGIATQDRSAIDGTNVSLNSATALQATYAHQIFEHERIRFLVGVHFLANGSRQVRSLNSAVPSSVATLYVTPDVALKFAPHSRFQPWLAIGGGYAQYESGKKVQDNSANAGKFRIHRGALVYGGGLDISVRSWLALRGEIRDFYSGSPQLNVPLVGGQHNVVAGGGFVFRFGQ